MENIKKILNTYYEIYRIPAIIFNLDNTICYFNNEESKLCFEYSNHNYEYLEICKKDKKCFLTIDSLHLSRVYIFLKEYNKILVLGYVFLGVRNQALIGIEIENRHMSENEAQIGLEYIMSIKQIMRTHFIQLIQFLYHYIYQENLCVDEKSFISDDTISSFNDHINISNECIYSAIDYQYSFESNILNYIHLGKKKKLEQFLLYDQSVQEYYSSNKCIDIEKIIDSFYSLCSLCCQEAINSGADYLMVYILKKKYFTKVKTLFSIESVISLINDMVLTYASIVSRLHTHKNYSYLTEMSIQYIENHVKENITLKQMAKEMNVSENYLGMLFKKETGEKINYFIKKLKIEEAKTLITTHKYSFIEISEMLSFSSQSYFNKVFKDITSITPKEFKDNINNGK